MDLEPVLLKATLGAIFDRFPMHALWASVEWHKLLLELCAISCHVMAATVKVSIALVLALQNFFQRAHFVFALANVENLVIRRCRNLAILRGCARVTFPIVLLLSFVVSRSIV